MKSERKIPCEARRCTNKSKAQSNIRVPCDVYSRVVGFYTPVGKWNTGKKQEWKDRRPYVINRIPEGVSMKE